MKKTFVTLVVAIAMSMVSCQKGSSNLVLKEQDQQELSVKPLACTNGVEILPGSLYSNIGGNGGVALNASATSLTGPGSSLSVSTGTLYRKAVAPSGLGSKTFRVYNGGNNGDVMVRVVAVTSSNAVLVLSAKKVSKNEDLSIKVCDASALSGYTSVHFEIYGINSVTIGWSWS